jgi:hypothetical protein
MTVGLKSGERREPRSNAARRKIENVKLKIENDEPQIFQFSILNFQLSD